MPTNDWTIEELLQWRLLQSIKKTNDHFDAEMEAIKKETAKKTADFIALYKELEANPVAAVGNENNTNAPPASRGATTITLRVEFVGGPYTNDVCNLSIKPRMRYPVGRSQGKRFKERGLSLHKDLEISTSHGRFELIDGAVHYIDTGSTNGSFLGKEKLKEDVPVAIKDGARLTLGQSELKLSLL